MKQLRIHELLTRAQLDELETFAREPGRTVDEIAGWMQDRGFSVSRNAAWNWQKQFNAQDRFKVSNDVARGLMEAAKEGGTVAISEAAGLQLSQMIFEQLLKLQASDTVSADDLRKCSMSLKNVIAGKWGLGKILEQKFEQEMKEKQKERPDGMLTKEAIEEARKKIFG